MRSSRFARMHLRSKIPARVTEMLTAHRPPIAPPIKVPVLRDDRPDTGGGLIADGPTVRVVGRVLEMVDGDELRLV